MKYETIIIRTIEGHMFDHIEVYNVQDNTVDKNCSNEKDKIIKEYNEKGYYVSAATDHKIYMTKNII